MLTETMGVKLDPGDPEDSDVAIVAGRGENVTTMLEKSGVED